MVELNEQFLAYREFYLCELVCFTLCTRNEQLRVCVRERCYCRHSNTMGTMQTRKSVRVEVEAPRQMISTRNIEVQHQRHLYHSRMIPRRLHTLFLSSTKSMKYILQVLSQHPNHCQYVHLFKWHAHRYLSGFFAVYADVPVYDTAALSCSSAELNQIPTSCISMSRMNKR